MALIARGWVRGPVIHDPRLEQTLFGVKFSNPLGLAAGFDKDAKAVSHWHKLGFGFVEIGTVTAHSQPGNHRSRLFRYPADHALINRLGFNNDGCEATAKRLRAAKPQIPVGVNIGKSKRTPLPDAASDYLASFNALRGLGQYAVVNVSSPNTAGLRTLQDKDALSEILFALRAVDDTTPLFVKVAPDLSDEALLDVVKVAEEHKLTGLIASNTTISREGLTRDPGQIGGLSGKPLKSKADHALKVIAQATKGQMTLIGVGGVFTGDDLWDKLRLGANLVQSYTGFVYGGPRFASVALLGLLKRMDAAGIQSISEIAQASG